MNTFIFLMSIILIVFFYKKTVNYTILGWLGFCMRGMAIGSESIVAIVWLLFQGILVYMALTHIPFSIVWN